MSSPKIPSTFTETVQLVERYVLKQIERETAAKQLYYHTVDHALAVKRRANLIFRAIEPVLTEELGDLDLSRVKNLIDLCAIAHDMVQNFAESDLDTPRKRPVGISERTTIARLIDYIQALDRKLLIQKVDRSARFTKADLEIIREAIAATICEREPVVDKIERGYGIYSIYQPYLYNSPANNSIVGQIIALADLGTLGIDGIEAYLHEGASIFVEDNPDLVRLILDRDGEVTNAAAEGKLKIRLLNMTRFMVNLARDRYFRFPQEISGFSDRAQSILQQQVFKNLTLENIQKIETITPTDANASLTELLSFFSDKLTKTA